jgi:RNA polymerase sigma-70 factor (ECF subfamily)
VVINTAIDRLRSGLHNHQVTELQPWHDVQNEPGLVEDLTREQILDMLDLLPPSYRTVFNLFTVDGFSHEEIADTLGISIGASKSNLSRARQHLKTILADDFEFSRKI